ncbi:MAG TPA: diguanylate cyclase [Rhodocyclaceae bacterium]|nr:diguanylate cyclase [Rhodocyclaceae bacterium]
MYSLFKESVAAAVVAGLAMLSAYLLALPSLAAMLLVAVATAAALIFIAHRARAQQAQRSHAFIQRLIDGIPDAFYIKGAGSRYLMVNKAYAEERGMAVEDIVGKTTWDIVGERVADEWTQEDVDAFAGIDVYKEQRVLHVVTGEERFRILSKRRVENEEGVGVVVGAHFNITQWKLAERELQAALAREQNHRERVHEYVQRLFDTIPMPVYVKDARSHYQIVNIAQEHEWGKTKDELIGVNSISLAPNEAVASTIAREDAAVLNGEVIYKEEHKRHAATRHEQFRVVSKGRCLDPYGQYVIVCTLFDTTQWRIAERKLQAALLQQTTLREHTLSFIQRVIDVIRDPFYIKDAEGRYLMVNEALAREHRQDKAALIGKLSYSDRLYASGAEDSLREDRDVIGGAELDKELHLTDSGDERFLQVVKRRCTDVDGAPVIVVAHFDITRWRVAERELARMAHEDPLTGLANRRSFFNEAKRVFSRADRYGEALSLLLFDLDHFKHVNDQHGHPVGDEVLSEVVRRTRASLRGEDIPCRWGGEEFVVLLPQMLASQASVVAERLRETIASLAFGTSAGELAMSISCGIAERRPDESITSLVARADAALYRAKDAGRNTCILAADTSPI